MRQAERLGTILEELSTRGSVAVTELSARLGVSAATARRDLEHLEAQHLFARTHGGAVAPLVSYELPLRCKSARRQEQKRRIGREADRALVERARRVVVVADGSKLGKVAFARICPLSAVDELVTDAEADPRELRAIREAGLSVTVV